MASRTETSQLAVSRAAARLFIANGVAATSGGDIAAAAGLSERTVWRYFRNKESCVAPLFARTCTYFAEELRHWPRGQPIEAHLAVCFDMANMSEEYIIDGVLAVHLIAALGAEPDLRSVWLTAYHDAEAVLAAIIADRLDRSHHDFEVRLCASAVLGAVRTVDETISLAAIRDGQAFTIEQIVAQMARAIRSVANLPFCDPVAAKPFGHETTPPAPTDPRTD